MSKIVLCSDSVESRARYLGTRDLPEKYMEDFTLMGFVVDNYSAAVDLVKGAGYSIDDYGGTSEVEIPGPGSLTKIQSLFTAHNIHCDYSDIADTIYQA